MTRTAIRLLLVEDDPSDAEIVREALSESRRPPFQVEHATHLRIAHDILAAGRTDLVLLDLGLPDAHGIEACQRLLDAHPDVPLIVLTGIEDDELGLRAVQRGAQDFVVKDRPAPEILARSIRYAIERHAMLGRLESAAREAKASEARFRTLIGRSAEGLLVVDGSGIVRFANLAAEALLRRSAADLLGTPLPFALGPGSPREVSVPRQDGTHFPADVRVARLDWEGGAARLVSIYDLSDRRRAEGAALAQAVQRAFLPERKEARAGSLEMCASNAPCEDASGDFYDFVALEDGRVAVAIGDVTGHGFGPALLMAQGRAYLRAFSRTLKDLPDVLAHVNDAVAADMTHGRFMSLFVALIDPHSASVRWSNAGHVPAFVLRARDGSVERLEATGLVLGVVPGSTYPEGRDVMLGPDDVLLLCSDGATEARDACGRPFGEARVSEVLRSEAGRGAEAVLAALRKAIQTWTGGRPAEDDLTLLAVRRLGLSRPTEREVPMPASAGDAPPGGGGLEIPPPADRAPTRFRPRPPLHPLPPTAPTASPPTEGRTP